MTFRPVTPQNSMGQNLGQVNDMIRQLNREQQVKTFKQPGGTNAIITGRLPFTTDDGQPCYGSLNYDNEGVPRILIGSRPGSGRLIMAFTKEGKDVIQLTEE